MCFLIHKIVKMEVSITIILTILILTLFLSLNFRFSSSLNILEGSPLNFDGLKGIGLSLTLLAIDEETKILQQVLASAKGMVQLKNTNFRPVVMQGKFYFILFYFILF